MTMTYPNIMQQAWCSGSGGTKGLVNTSIPTAAASPSASLNDGFPLTTMTLGGTPPKGADMNGILYWISQYCVWNYGGGQYSFSSAFATSPGYSAGAVVQLNSGLSSYVNLVANNTNDPNSVLTNWAPWAGAVKINVADLIGTTNLLGAALVAYNSVVAASYAAGTVGLNLYTALGNAATALTNASNAQASATSALTSIGNLGSTAAVYGAGMIGYSSASAYAANTVGSALKALPASLFATQNNVTGSRSAATSYSCPGGNSKPMFIAVKTSASGSNGQLSATVNGLVVDAVSLYSAGSLSVAAMVPPGGTYSITWSGLASIDVWIETY